MSRAKRGGLTLKTGNIGHVNCLRQDLMMPGERMDMRMSGTVKLETLRERDVLRIHAHLATFMTPLRWLEPTFPQFLKEGPDTAVTLGTATSDGDWDSLGIGSYTATPPTPARYDFWENAYLRCVNEWYKWPENADFVAGDINDTGVKAVPLAATWSRARLDATSDASDDYTLASATNFDVRDLAEKQAKFRSAMKRDVLSYNRWMELIEETYRGDGSREVDQVPIMLDQTEIGVNPREMPATDGASLGTWQSMFDFGVDHTVRGIVAPEHCVITTLLTVRFSSTLEGRNPLSGRLEWEELAADPEWITAAKPQVVEFEDVLQVTNNNTLGYLPAGWQWRSEFDVIGKSVDIRDTFAYYDTPTTQAHTKDASRIKDAFRSSALDDMLISIYFNCDSRQPIGGTMDSYFSGMLDDVVVNTGGNRDEFPKGGKML